jgi:glycerophosphoryl diester phosphodiesterase
VFAHRGASIEFPENTLPAFRRAAEAGADAIETDTHFTKDGRFIMMHDLELERISDGSGPVTERTVAEIKKLDAGYRFTRDGGATYPFRGKGITFLTLEEMLEEFPDMRFNIDLKDKNPAQVQHFVELVKKMNAGHRVLAASENRQNNRAVRRLYPELATSFALWEALGFYFLFRSGLLLFKKKFAPDALQIPEFLGPSHVANETLIRMAHERGLRVHVWTINDEKTMRRLYNTGVDAVMSDDPALLKKVAGEFFRD